MICDECELLLRALALLKIMFSGKVFYIVLNCEGLLWESVTLCLSIPLVPVMYPWVWVVTKLVSEHWLDSCIFIVNVCFLYCCGDWVPSCL